MANDEGELTPEQELVLRGAARASIRTGCPISTHHWAGEEVGRDQLKVFQEEGVPPHQVCIGHSADTEDLDYLEDLLKAGVYLSLDRYPAPGPRALPWETRNATVQALIDRGWVARLMLGHDSAPRVVRPGATRGSPVHFSSILVSTVRRFVRRDGRGDSASNQWGRQVTRQARSARRGPVGLVPDSRASR